MEQKIIPTWGYKSDGTAQIFDLEEGEDLPDGWSDRPEPRHHPNTAHLPENLATADTQPRKRRSRPPKSQEPGEEPDAELASELRDE